MTLRIHFRVYIKTLDFCALSKVLPNLNKQRFESTSFEMEIQKHTLFLLNFLEYKIKFYPILQDTEELFKMKQQRYFFHPTSKISDAYGIANKAVTCSGKTARTVFGTIFSEKDEALLIEKKLILIREANGNQKNCERERYG